MAVPDTSADHFLPRQGVQLRYRDEGRGLPLVLVHGWALDLAAWDAVQPALAARLRVLRMDRRGFGASSGPPDIDADADDVLALLDRLGIAAAAVLGHSQGARVALELARRAPARVAALILDGTPALPDLPGGPWVTETPLEPLRDRLRSEGRAALERALTAHPLMRLHGRDPAARAALESMLARNCAAAVEAPAPAANARPGGEPPAVPVLVLNGEFDTPQRLAVGEAFAAITPGARRSLVAGAGHLACLDQPQAYARLVADFLNRSLAPPIVPSTEPT